MAVISGACCSSRLNGRSSGWPTGLKTEKALASAVPSRTTTTTNSKGASGVRCLAAAAKERTVVELNEGIANFYDSSSGVWEDVWGEHMHHGYYEPGSQDNGGHLVAQVRMIEESLAWAGIPGNHPFHQCSFSVLFVNFRREFLAERFLTFSS